MMVCIICHNNNDNYRFIEIRELIKLLSNFNKKSTIKILSESRNEYIEVNICNSCNKYKGVLI